MCYITIIDLPKEVYFYPKSAMIGFIDVQIKVLFFGDIVKYRPGSTGIVVTVDPYGLP